MSFTCYKKKKKEHGIELGVVILLSTPLQTFSSCLKDDEQTRYLEMCDVDKLEPSLQNEILGLRQQLNTVLIGEELEHRTTC